jgi:hypothetical protein
MKRPLHVTVDQGADLKALRRLQHQGVVSLHKVHDLEQDFDSVAKQGGAFTLNRSMLDGCDMLAGEEAGEVQRIVGKGADCHHLLSASLNHSDVFVTGDKDDFIKDGKRERLEGLLGLKIRTTKEFLTELAPIGD